MSLLKRLICCIMCISLVMCEGGVLPGSWNNMQWNNNMRSLTITAAKNIPFVGGVVGAVISIAWPEKKESIWDQIYEQTEKLIDEKILENNYEKLKSLLDDVHDSMYEYNNTVSYTAKSNIEAGNFLVTAIEQCSDVKNFITESSEYLHFFQYMVPLSALHLINLRERYVYGDVLYEERNEAFWKKDLNDTYIFYKKWFDSNYPKWRSTRENALSGSTKAGTWQVADSVTETTVKGHAYTLSGYGSSPSGWVQGTKNVMLNEATSDMLNLIVSTFYLHQYLPWMENQTSAIITNNIPSSFIVGPYAGSTIQYSHMGTILAGYDTKMLIDDGGIINGFTVRAPRTIWDSSAGPKYGITKLQMNYTTHSGNFIDYTSHASTWHKLDIVMNPEQKWINSCKICFEGADTNTHDWPNSVYSGVLSYFGVGYNDGTVDHDWMQIDGNCWSAVADVSLSDEFVLTSIGQQKELQKDPVNHNNRGIGVIQLHFTHKSIISLPAL